VNASTNGQLQFSSIRSTYYNACLPSPGSTLNNAILGYSADLNMVSTITTTFALGIYTRTDGSSPNRTFTVEWRACKYAGTACNEYANFEIVLYESGEQFDIIYGRVDDGGTAATVGVQKRTGQRHTNFECNTGGLTNGLKVHGALAA